MLCIAALSKAAGEGAAHAWRQTGTSLSLCDGAKTVWCLVADPEIPKAYFHPLATPDGDALTAFEPADHPWHRGLWWSWKFINGLNYWEEDRETRKSEGVTELTGVVFKPGDDFSARAELSFSYHPPGQPAVMTELRELSITRPDADGSYRIDWTSGFKAGNAPVTLGRTPLAYEDGGKSYGGYAGLSVRLVSKPKAWVVRTSGRGNGVADVHGRNAGWMGFSSGGSGIVVIDHSENPRHPSPWYAHDSPPMSFFSPAVLFNEPLVLAAGQSLEFRYRILIHSKAVTEERIQAECLDFDPPAK